MHLARVPVKVCKVAMQLSLNFSYLGADLVCDITIIIVYTYMHITLTAEKIMI